MTTRERVITSAGAKAIAAIRREAAANGEQVHEQTRETVRRHVTDACSTDARAEAFNAPRVIAAVIRDVEASAHVKRGWWS